MYEIQIKGLGNFPLNTIKEAFEFAIFNYQLGFEVDVVSTITGEVVMILDKYNIYVAQSIHYSL